MPGAADLDINRAVRRILIKHWIDLGRIAVRSTRGRLMIYGNLKRITGRDEPLGPPVVEAIFHDIQRINGVVAVGAHLDNWTNEGGRWREFVRPGTGSDKRADLER